MNFVKIGIVSDAHANLPALEAVLNLFDKEKCDRVYHLGDAVCLGGYSNECLDLLKQKAVVCLMGNHDKDYLENNFRQKPMSHTSTAHKEAVFARLGESYKAFVKTFPLSQDVDLFGLKVSFMHYALTGDDSWPFQGLEFQPTKEAFDKMFEFCQSDLIFFGHKHEKTLIVGKKTYCDVGSAGCHPRDTAEGVILTVFEDKSYTIDRVGVVYDRQQNLRRMLEIGIPDAKYIFDFYYDRKYSHDNDASCDAKK